MEKRSSYMQAALASLAGLVVGTVALLLVTDLAGVNAVVGPLFALTVTLTAIVIPLLYWRNTVGYIGALVVAVLTLITQSFVLLEVLDGNLASETLVALGPGMFFAVLALFAIGGAWAKRRRGGPKPKPAAERMG